MSLLELDYKIGAKFYLKRAPIDSGKKQIRLNRKDLFPHQVVYTLSRKMR